MITEFRKREFLRRREKTLTGWVYDGKLVGAFWSEFIESEAAKKGIFLKDKFFEDLAWRWQHDLFFFIGDKYFSFIVLHLDARSFWRFFELKIFQGGNQNPIHIVSQTILCHI